MNLRQAARLAAALARGIQREGPLRLPHVVATLHITSAKSIPHYIQVFLSRKTWVHLQMLGEDDETPACLGGAADAQRGLQRSKAYTYTRRERDNRFVRDDLDLSEGR